MRQPPRQPPRQAPKASKAPKPAAKPRGGGPRKPPPKAPHKGSQKSQASRGTTQAQARATAEQQRRQREVTWWTANQVAKDRLSSSQHAAGSDAIGTILNGDRRARWRTSNAAGAITLLVLSAFLASMAMGAQSLGVGILSFLCFAGTIAFITFEYSARRFPEPIPTPPLIGEHRLEDLIVEDDLPRPRPAPEAPATIDMLEEMFEEVPPVEAPSPQPGQADPSPQPGQADPSPQPGQADPSPQPSPVPEPEPEPPARAREAAPEPKVPQQEQRIPSPPREADPEVPNVIAAPAAPQPDPEPTPEPAPPKAPQQERRSALDNLTELLLSSEALSDTDITDVAATLIVADLERSVHFYSEALGLIVGDRTDEAAVLEAGFGKILLWERPDAPPGETGVMHLTFEVGDIDAAFAQMNEAGVEFLHLPRTALLGQHYELHAAAFRDPDGHGLAITEHRER